MTDSTPSTREALISALLGKPVWPVYTPVPNIEEHLHALGVIITRYNDLEFVAFLLIYHYLNGDPAIAALIFSRLNNQSRTDILLRYGQNDKSQDVTKRVEHFVSAYNICTENRNYLAHSQIDSGQFASQLNLGLGAITPTIVLKKAPRNEPLNRNYAHLAVSDLRSIADDIQIADRFGFDLFRYLHAQPSEGRPLPSGKGPAPALPDIPLLPRALTLSRIATPEVEQPQP
jgi:hypothetical protein